MASSRLTCAPPRQRSRRVETRKAEPCPLLSPFSLPLLSPSTIVTLLLSSSFLRLLCPPLLATAGLHPATAPPPAEQRAETAAAMLATRRHAVVWLLQPWPPVVLLWPWCARSLSFTSALLATPSTSPPCDASPASLLRLPPLPWAPPLVCPSRVPLLSAAMLPQAVMDHAVPLRVCAWAWASVCTAARHRRPSPAGQIGH